MLCNNTTTILLLLLLYIHTNTHTHPMLLLSVSPLISHSLITTIKLLLFLAQHRSIFLSRCFHKLFIIIPDLFSQTHSYQTADQRCHFFYILFEKSLKNWWWQTQYIHDNIPNSMFWGDLRSKEMERSYQNSLKYGEKKKKKKKKALFTSHIQYCRVKFFLHLWHLVDGLIQSDFQLNLILHIN